MGITNGRASSLKILVVDDDPGFCQLMEVILGLRPVVDEVQSTTSPAVALDLCRRFSPDVAIVDHFMPGMDGDQLGAKLRTLHPQAWLLSMTGMREKPKPRWADAHVMKDGEMFQTIERLLFGDR